MLHDRLGRSGGGGIIVSALAYHLGQGLYLNVTNRCTNACSFCIRNGHDTVGDSDVLWLTSEPTVDELWNALLEELLPETEEIVFCGYGEPLMRYDAVLELCRRIRAHCSLPIRINTNGHGDLIAGQPLAPLFSGLVDVISISLNAPNAKRYDEICAPVYHDAYAAVLAFAVSCKKTVPTVCFSVVDQPLTQDEIAACRAVADKLGIPLRVRTFE